MLDAAAVAGREFGVELLAAVGPWSMPEVSDALQEAIRDGIVIEVPDTWTASRSATRSCA